MFGDIIQPTHLLFILVVALLVLGPKRLPEVGRSLGKGIRDFRSAVSGIEEQTHGLLREDQPSAVVTPVPELCGDYGGAGRRQPDRNSGRGIPGSGHRRVRAGAVGVRGLRAVQRHGYRRRMEPAVSVMEETAALVALLRAGGRPWTAYILAAREAGGARPGLAQAVLDQELRVDVLRSR